jgi:hypothetical protein
MKKLLLTLAAIPAATLAVESQAQTYQTYANSNANVTVQNQVGQLQAQLNAGIRSGTIDATEARRLRQEIRALNRLRTQYASNGLTNQEWNVLQQRVGNLSQQIQVAYGYNGYNQGNGYAYGNSGVAYDQYGRPIQNGYPVQNNGYYGQGGPYVPYQAPRTNSGVGGVLGSVLGGVLGGGSGNILGSILSNGGLRIGDVITGVLGNVLGGASNLGYQDRSNVYFRTDGQRVYEIDARTNQVIRIHPAY